MKPGLGRKGVVFVVFLFCGVLYGKPWPGSGDVNDPYLIHNAQQMQAIGADANYWGAHFKLMKDIDLSDYTGESFNIIGNDVNAFTGIFDGDGHTISNFTYNSNGVEGIGIFGSVYGPTAEVKNLGLLNPDVNAADGDLVGGLVGNLWEGIVTNCYVEGGGVSGGYIVGGLAGINYDGEIADCYSTSNVTGEYYVGGLAGVNGYGSIRNCYSTGVVTGGGWSIGGLVGYNEGGYGEVINSYWDTESSGIDTSYWGVGLTTADMHSKHTFFLWGCEGGWTIDEGNDYPRLAWEGKVGEAIEGFGCGTEEEPYLVYGASSMYVIGGSGNYDKHYKVMADIDVGGYIWTSRNIIGRYSESIDNSPFTGVFDGDGRTISNFTCDSNNTERIGLFGYVDDAGAEIKDLGLINPNVEAGTRRCVGGLVGLLAEGSVSGCYIEGGSVAGYSSVGGLVGEIQDENGSILNCYSTAGVTGGGYFVGGLVGMHWSGDIDNCYSTGSVAGAYRIGGLVGQVEKLGFIRNSYWDVNSSGVEVSNGGFGLTTEQMQNKSTYLFWGCEPVWTIDDGNDYPRLAWEGKPGGVIDYGCGTEEEPYLIYDGSSMYVIGAIYSKYNYFYCDDCDNVDKHYRLMADVDLSEYTGTSFNIIGSPYRYHNCFTGVFDGNGHSISNFTYECNGVDNIGLFGYVCEEGEVRDVVLINPDVNAGDGIYVGALVGYLGPNSLTGCRVEGGRVRGGYEGIGGLLGFGEYVSLLYNCGYEGSVRGEYRSVGGLAGKIQGEEETEISKCYSRGVVTGLESAGGLVGYCRSSGSISNCCSESIVTGESYVGGLVGRNGGDISNSYSTGDVTGEDYVGGLAGGNRGVISNSYSTGNVTGEDYVGGLVGYGDSFIKCFWDSEVNPDVNGIGNTTDPNVVGLPTVLMQAESTYTDAGWDFVGEVINGTEDIWKMNCEGMSYPKLSWWEAALGDFVCPDGVDMVDFGVLGDAWMSGPGDGHWDAGCDISEPNDERIDGLDLEVFVGNWLEGM